MKLSGSLPHYGFVLFLFLTTGALIASSARADPLPRPQGRVILTVTGKIGNTNADGSAMFDRAMLEALGVSELTTKTVWTEGPARFEGVLASKLLEAVAAAGEIADTRAINDYKVEIPVSDFQQYPVLLALKMNGAYMRVRDKGPIWVVYPWDQYPELNDEQTKQKAIWQLNEIHIR